MSEGKRVVARSGPKIPFALDWELFVRSCGLVAPAGSLQALVAGAPATLVERMCPAGHAQSA